MPAKKTGRPKGRKEPEASVRSEIVDLYRGFSGEKAREAGTVLNGATLSVWAATFILCSLLVYGLHQVRGRLDGIQAALEQSEQDKKLLLEGMDELLVRAERPDQLFARAETPGREDEITLPPPSPPERNQQAESGKGESNDLARRYKIYYRTKDGENLARVSEKFNVSEDQVRLWNALKASDALIPGQVLVINKSTQPDRPVVARGPSPSASPPDAERLEKKEKPDAAALEEVPVHRPDAAEGTGDTLTAEREAPTPEPPETLAGEPGVRTVHVVQEGESLSTIGQEHGVSWIALAALNGIEPPGTIYVGQRLSIPDVSDLEGITVPSAEVKHRVQRGENLYRIGRLYNLNWERIAQANGISDPSQLYAGQVLKIPAARGGPEL